MHSLKKQMEMMLEQIVDYVKNDPRISAIWIVGSFATGMYDDFSDIDLYLLISDDMYSKVYEDRIQIAQTFGTILSTFEVKWDNCDMLGVIYEYPIEVDFCFTRLHQIEVFAPFKILYDKTGGLGEILQESYPNHQETPFDVSDLENQFRFFAYNLLQAINKLGRENFWSAIRQVEIMRKRIIKVIGFREGEDVSEEFTKVKTLMKDEEINQLNQTLCKYNPKSINQAIHACSKLFEKVTSKIYNNHGIEYNHDLHKVLIQRLETISHKENRR